MSSTRVTMENKNKRDGEMVRHVTSIRLSAWAYLIEYAMPFGVQLEQKRERGVGQMHQESSLHQTKRQIKECTQRMFKQIDLIFNAVCLSGDGGSREEC